MTEQQLRKLETLCGGARFLQVAPLGQRRYSFEKWCGALRPADMATLRDWQKALGFASGERRDAIERVLNAASGRAIDPSRALLVQLDIG